MFSKLAITSKSFSWFVWFVGNFLDVDSVSLIFCKQFGIHITCNATRMQAGKAMQRGIQVGLVLASISTRSRALKRCIGCCRLVDCMSSRLHCVVTVHSLHSRRLPSRRWCSYEPTRLVCFCGAEESASVGCACLGGHMHWVLQSRVFI